MRLWHVQKKSMGHADITVELAYSPAPRQVDLQTLTLASGASVRQALAASQLLTRYPELDVNTLTVGLWGRRTTLDHTVRAGDRVEVYRPLKVDPKEARRVRYRAQGDRGRVRRKKPEPV